MYEIHNLMYFYHRIYPASGPSRNCKDPADTLECIFCASCLSANLKCTALVGQAAHHTWVAPICVLALRAQP